MVCESPLLIHRDGTMSCAVPGCADARTTTDVERALVQHRVRVPCDDAGAKCARCHPSPQGSQSHG